MNAAAQEVIKNARMEGLKSLPYANHHGYTDVSPCEVVRVVSDKCLEIRRMDSERDPNWKPEMVVGGFCAHTVNNHEQKWIITSNQEYKSFKIRLQKNGAWKDKYGDTYHLNKEPRRFYDYNF